VIFFAAARAVVGQLSAWHRKEEAVISVDEFDVTNDEGVIEGQGAEGLEAVVLVLGLAKFNPDVSQAHKDPISILRDVLSKKVSYKRCASVSNLSRFSFFPEVIAGSADLES